MKLVYRESGFIQAQHSWKPRCAGLRRGAPRTGKRGGIAHFGFRLINPADIDAAATTVTKAGRKILSKGEFCPGEPYLFFTDPDGYEVEIWFELPTPVDPKRE